MRQSLNRKQSQLVLFQPPIKTPTWNAMAPEVKEKTIRLLSRLLRQYRERRNGLASTEAGHE